MSLRSVEQYMPHPSARVILRMDLDVPDNDNSRLEKSLDTVRYLLQNDGKIAIIGHKGRPSGNGYEEKYSLKKVFEDFKKMLGEESDMVFLNDFETITENRIQFFENLRFWKEEEKNERSFLKNLIDNTKAFVNDAPAVAHRKHASMMLHETMDTYYGKSFIREIGQLEEIYNKIQHPVTFILGGKKEDKLKNIKKFLQMADRIVIAGMLPNFMDKYKDTDLSKVYICELNETRYDLSDKDVETTKKIIKDSKTTIVVGAPSWFEREDSQKGTINIANALMANKDSLVIFAGGDTGASFKKFGVEGQNIVQVSGGGATLDYLASGTLPAISK